MRHNVPITFQHAITLYSCPGLITVFIFLSFSHLWNPRTSFGPQLLVQMTSMEISTWFAAAHPWKFMNHLSRNRREPPLRTGILPIPLSDLIFFEGPGLQPHCNPQRWMGPLAQRANIIYSVYFCNLSAVNWIPMQLHVNILVILGGNKTDLIQCLLFFYRNLCLKWPWFCALGSNAELGLLFLWWRILTTWIKTRTCFCLNRVMAVSVALLLKVFLDYSTTPSYFEVSWVSLYCWIPFCRGWNRLLKCYCSFCTPWSELGMPKPCMI